MRLNSEPLVKRLRDAGKIGGLQLAVSVPVGRASGSAEEPGVYVDKTLAAELDGRHAAPEVVFEGRFSHKSDVWAAGVLVWQALAKGVLHVEHFVTVIVRSISTHTKVFNKFLVDIKWYIFKCRFYLHSTTTSV